MLKTFTPSVKGDIFQIDFFLVIRFTFDMIFGEGMRQVKIPVKIQHPPAQQVAN